MFCEAYVVLSCTRKIGLTDLYCIGVLPGFHQFSVCETWRLLPDRKHIRCTDTWGLWFDSLQSFCHAYCTSVCYLLCNTYTFATNTEQADTEGCSTIPLWQWNHIFFFPKVLPRVVHAAAVETAKFPVVVMLIIILSHGRSGQARKQQLLEDISFTLIISEACRLWASLKAVMLLLLVGNYALH